MPQTIFDPNPPLPQTDAEAAAMLDRAAAHVGDQSRERTARLRDALGDLEAGLILSVLSLALTAPHKRVKAASVRQYWPYPLDEEGRRVQ